MREASALAPQETSDPTESTVEQNYSLAIATAKHTQDLALADAQRLDMLEQTAADNTQRQSDATANAALLSAQYAAKVPAMQVLADDVGASLLTEPPWAEYQVARAVVERDAWEGWHWPAQSAESASAGLKSDYLAWQQQVSDAYTTYVNARASAYGTSAIDIADRTYTDAQYSANRTAEEVATLAGDELSFEQNLAQKVYNNREALASADKDDRNGRAAFNHDGTPYDESPVQHQRDAAASDYQTGYITLDGQRRHDMAAAGLSFVQDLASHAQTAANFIANDEGAFDTAVANAYYVAGMVPMPSAGLEFTLASLAKNYDLNYATTFATALSDLATAALAASPGDVVAGASDPATWALLAKVAAQEAQSHLTAVDIPSANATFAARVAQAAQDNLDNLSAGSTDRAHWLADLTAQANLAIAAAQATLASASAGGNPNLVSAPGDLAVPAVDLGAVGDLSTWSSLWNSQVSAPAPLQLMGWFDPARATWPGYGPYTYGPTWGDPIVHAQTNYSGGYYQWYDSGAYGWAVGYHGDAVDGWWSSVGYGWWSDAGSAAAFWPVSDPFGGQFAGPNLDPGTYWWLPGYSGLPNTPASVDPTAAIQEEQTAVATLSAVATIGKDVLAIAKNLAPVEIHAATGVATVVAAAGFTAVAVGTDGGTPNENQNGGSGDPDVEPISAYIRRLADRINELHDHIDETGDPEAIQELAQLEGFYLPCQDNVVAETSDPVWQAMTFNDFAGQRWDGRTVLEIIKAYEGENAELVANFVASHYKLHVAIDYSSPFWAFVLKYPRAIFGDPTRRPDQPQVEIKGFGGKGITSVSDISSASEAHAARIDLGIPDSWDSAAVARYILQSMGDDPVINKIAEDEFAGRSATIVTQLQGAAFASAASQAEAIIGTYYRMLAGLAPGGSVAVAVYALQQGEFIGAALEVVFMGPVAKLAGSAVGFVAMKVGDKILGHIPVGAIKAFQELGAAEKETLLAGLRSAKTEEEATAQLAKILKRCGDE